MIKIVIITVIVLLFIQFILYYCNVDIFKHYIKSVEKKPEIDTDDLEETKNNLKVFLNELKQYDNNS